MNSRDEILNRIKTVRNKRSLFHSIATNSEMEIYKPILPDALTCFKNELETVSGKCFVCENEKDVFVQIRNFVSKRGFSYLFCKDKNLIPKLAENKIPFSAEQEDFETMQAGITSCEFLVARTGSVMVSSALPSGRQMYIFPPVHIVVACESQLVNYVEDALLAIRQEYGNVLPSAITTITGPSRTADIEKTLVLGAHGPKEIVVFISKT